MFEGLVLILLACIIDEVSDIAKTQGVIYSRPFKFLIFIFSIASGICFMFFGS